MNVIKTTYGFAIVTDMNKFNEFKPNFEENTGVRQVDVPNEGQIMGPTEEELQNSDEIEKEECEGWDSNPRTPAGVDLKSTAFGRAWLPSLKRSITYYPRQILSPAPGKINPGSPTPAAQPGPGHTPPGEAS